VIAYVRAADVPGAPADNSVSTAKIVDDAVTFSKLQNIASGRILGRATAGSGNTEELTALPAGISVPAAGLTGDVDADRITNALNASGSAPIYACRAWVNFNGTGTVAIRSSGNVSSITDNGTGLYTVNFTTAMPDTNFVVAGTATPEDEVSTGSGSRWVTLGSGNSHIGRSTTFVRVVVAFGTTSYSDGTQVNIAVHR
jgi:hypothetical protein